MTEPKNPKGQDPASAPETHPEASSQSGEGASAEQLSATQSHSATPKKHTPTAAQDTATAADDPANPPAQAAPTEEAAAAANASSTPAPPSAPEAGQSASRQDSPPEPPGKSRSDKPSGAPPAAPPPKGRGLLWLAVLLILLATGVTLFTAYQVWQQQAPLLDRMETLQDQEAQRSGRVQELQGQLEQVQGGFEGQQQQLQRQLQQQQQSLEQQQQSLQQLQQALNQQQSNQQQLAQEGNQQDRALRRLSERVDSHQQRLVALSTNNREDWLLAEAQYLLKLANQRILLERSPVNALALLESADRILRRAETSNNDPELHAVREAIARDLTALRMVEPIDRAGLYLQLQSLGERLDQLPRTPKPTMLDAQGRPQPVDGEPAPKKELSWWRTLWAEIKSAVGFLGDYVKIGDTESTIQPLASQQAMELADLNVRLLLEQAQVALLREQVDIYQNSLERAAALVQRYYLDSEPARNLQQTLAQLGEQPITTDLPDISRSAQLLSSYMEQLNRPAEGE